jgi:hypothetical protein
MWHVDKSHTTPYHPQADGIVERNNRGLGDSLRTLLLNSGQEEWDLLLPQLMRAFRGTPHSTTGETANDLMLGRELRLPDQLQFYPPPTDFLPQHKFAQATQERLAETHDLLRSQQTEIRQEDQEEPLLFTESDMVWLLNKRRRKGENPKLQPRFVGPYKIIEARKNHTYRIERQGQSSVQNEGRLKLYRECTEPTGKAPTTLEPRRRPNMKGATRQQPKNAELLPEVPPLELPAQLPKNFAREIPAANPHTESPKTQTDTSLSK